MHYNRETILAEQMAASTPTRTYGIPATDESGLPGEALLIAAFFRLMVADARRSRPHRHCCGERLSDAESAIEFLRDTARVTYWAELLDADGATIQAQLLQAAGLALE